MITLSYRSDANLVDYERQIPLLIDKAKENNLKLGLTSIILFDDVRFMQTLEGSKAVVSTLFHKIMDDGRHRNVIPFGVSKLEKRKFPHWSLEWVGVAQTTLTVPDMYDFDFSDRRLCEIHKEILAANKA